MRRLELATPLSAPPHGALLQALSVTPPCRDGKAQPLSEWHLTCFRRQDGRNIGHDDSLLSGLVSARLLATRLSCTTGDRSPSVSYSYNECAKDDIVTRRRIAGFLYLRFAPTAPWVLRLTFDMSGGLPTAQPAVRRPLDGGVRRCHRLWATPS
jgi:hypothetical protein